MIRIASTAIAFALAGCSSKPSSEESIKKPPPGEAWLTQDHVRNARIVVESVKKQDVGGRVVTSGEVAFDDQRVSHVFSPVTGRIVRINGELGERVKKGEPLAVIESPDVGSTFSDLAKAHADLVVAEKEYQRQKELYEAHAGSARDYESATDEYNRAKAEHQRANAKAQLLRGSGASSVTQEYILRAPIDGEIIARTVSPGMEVQGQYVGGNSAELFTVGELTSVWVLADIFEMDVDRVKVGAPVTIQVVGNHHKVYKGRADWISGSLDSTTKTAKLRCTVPNPDRELKPEMYATVSILVDPHKALAIPRGAVLKLGDQTVVFVERGAVQGTLVRFERRPVEVDDEEGGDYVPVSRGLIEGEHVVTSGAILLSGMI